MLYLWNYFLNNMYRFHYCFHTLCQWARLAVAIFSLVLHSHTALYAKSFVLVVKGSHTIVRSHILGVWDSPLVYWNRQHRPVLGTISHLCIHTCIHTNTHSYSEGRHLRLLGNGRCDTHLLSVCTGPWGLPQALHHLPSSLSSSPPLSHMFERLYLLPVVNLSLQCIHVLKHN